MELVTGSDIAAMTYEQLLTQIRSCRTQEEDLAVKVEAIERTVLELHQRILDFRRSRIEMERVLLSRTRTRLVFSEQELREIQKMRSSHG